MGNHAALGCSILLALHVHAGAQVVEHADYDDRVAWVLPPDRLAAFARGGVVIDEDTKTMIVAHATASSVPRGMTTFVGTLVKETQDVPRHRTQRSMIDLNATITPRNELLPARIVDIEDAGMTELPTHPLCMGQTWQTRLPVLTTLGSGTATIEHRVVGINAGLVEVDVRGAGVITGLEYNLPRLLPGTIDLRGTAWYDPVSGLVSHESYLVRDRLLRTVKNKTIGFIETETVDTTDHASVSTVPHRS